MSTGSSEPPETPLDRQTLSTRVRDFLLVEIANGRLAPGTPLRELEIARRLGTSQSPVREAFRELVALGLLETRTHVGTRVRKVDEQDLSEAVPVRAVLEGLAARLAAPRVAADPEPLTIAFDRMVGVADDGDRLAYANASTQFHREIVKAAGNGSLLRAWSALGIEVLTIMTMLTTEETLHAAAESHRPLLEALSEGDIERSVEMVTEHVAAYVPGYSAALADDGPGLAVREAELR